MRGLEIALGTSSLPVWAVGAAAALVVMTVVAASYASGARGFIGLIGRAALVLIALSIGWIVLDRAALHERQADRRALDQRMVELAAHAIAPKSALACLDAMAGDTVEAACEKTVFATPEAVAAAVSYVAARSTLLADAAAYAQAKDPAYDAVVAPLRLALETDRFGIVAHIFAMRDSCTALQCDSLKLLRDPSRVQANLKERTFDIYITRYAADWSGRATPDSPAVADTGAPPSLASTSAAPTPGVPLSPRYDFPSAASIPPVSIMNAEPAAAPAAPPAATPKPAAAPAPPRRAASSPPSPPPRPPSAPAPPVQLVPPSNAAGQPSR